MTDALLDAEAKSASADDAEARGLAGEAIAFLGMASAACLLLLAASGLAFAALPQGLQGSGDGVGWEAALLVFYLGLVVFGCVGVALSRMGGLRVGRRSCIGVLVVCAACLVVALAGCWFDAAALVVVRAVALAIALAFVCSVLLALWAMCISLRSIEKIRLEVSFAIALGIFVCLALRDVQWLGVVASLSGLLSVSCLIVEFVRFDGGEVAAMIAAPSQIQIRFKSFVIDVQTGMGIGATTGVVSVSMQGGSAGVTSLLVCSMISLFVGALLSVLLVAAFRETYYLRMKYLHALLFGVGLLAFLVLPSSCALGICCYLSVVCVLFICLHSTSTIEFLRYYSDHPFRIIFLGVVGFFVGAFLALAAFVLVRWGFGGTFVFGVAALVVAVQMGLMLVITLYCVYPYDATFELEVQKATDVQRGEPGMGHCRRKAQLSELMGHYDLTDRESQVLELMARGRNAKYITDTLVISPSTTKTHIYHLYAKLGIHSQQELIDMVERTQVKL